MWQALCKALRYNVDPIPNSMQVGNTQFRLKHYRDSMLLNRSHGGVSLKTRSSTIPRDIKNGSYIKDYPELLRIGKFWFLCMFAAESLFLRVSNHHFISCFSSLENAWPQKCLEPKVTCQRWQWMWVPETLQQSLPEDTSEVPPSTLIIFR